MELGDRLPRRVGYKHYQEGKTSLQRSIDSAGVNCGKVGKTQANTFASINVMFLCFLTYMGCYSAKAAD